MKPSDISIILKGLEAVGKSVADLKRQEINAILNSPSFKELTTWISRNLEEKTSSSISFFTKPDGLRNFSKETFERTSVVLEGIKQYSIYAAAQNVNPQPNYRDDTTELDHPIIHEPANFPDSDLPTKTKTIVDKFEKDSISASSVTDDSALSKDFKKNVLKSEKVKLDVLSDIEIQKYISKPKVRTQKLSDRSRERKVPSSRVGRLFSYGSLAAGIGLGAVAEVTRRTLGFSPASSSKTQALLEQNPFLSEANANRIVDTLCKVRGAALKLGQMLSLQDSAMIDPQLASIFERVRQSADFMPFWQMEQVMEQEFGSKWKDKFLEFESRPFAAASIGQVHRAVLQDKTEVALKIQYPGVAEGIRSDIKSLMGIVKLWNLLPKGMYIDNVMSVAERELKYEVDYLREAEAGNKFRKLLEPFPQYIVPKVYEDLCTTNILTTELIYGSPIDSLIDEDQETRNMVAKELLRLCLNEIFIFRFMQTDPNWSNFFYNHETKKVTLLDFGASREYSQEFVSGYLKIIKSAADQDKESVLKWSKDLGFLTGYETKVMEDAHVEAVTILGEAFASSKPFDFGKQSMTLRIHHLVPIMLQHRLTPPPEETYSLHRKMSGIFLLCTKLKAVIDCKTLFDDIYDQHNLLQSEYLKGQTVPM